MKTFSELVRHLREIGALATPAFISAFEAIDRKDFVPKGELDFAYENVALPIGKEQTISQPYTVAFMFELLSPKKGETILDVGSGSGYTTALLAHVVGKSGRVIGVELIPELVAFGKNNLSKYAFANAEIVQAGEREEEIDRMKFDKILVSASASSLPEYLVRRLKVGGVMVIPIGSDIVKVTKRAGGHLVQEKYEGFVFVPLIESHHT